MEDKKYKCESCGIEYDNMPEDKKCGCGGEIKESCGCGNGEYSENCCKE